MRSAIFVGCVFVVVLIVGASLRPSYTAVAPAVGASAEACAGGVGRLSSGATLSVGSRVALQVCGRLASGEWRPVSGSLRVENLGGQVQETDAGAMSAARRGMVIRAVSPGPVRVTAISGELSAAVRLVVVP